MEDDKNISGQKLHEPRKILSIKKLLKNVKKIFPLWLASLVLTCVIVSGINLGKGFANRQLSVTVNFSFDGIESGRDPSGNKFDVNGIRSKSNIKKAAEELGIQCDDADKIYSCISISGNIPADVINRITKYTSMYDTEVVETSRSIKDLTYYPTQYKITLDCYKLDELSFDECAALLNLLVEKYRDTFFERYGYKRSIEDAVISIDHNDYDYIDAVNVFDTNLVSLKNYISELEQKDEVRFRSEKSGFTFSDISKSIETMRSEDLDMLSSYITLYNVTKNKENLIAKYRFKTEELERRSRLYEKMLEGIEETLKVYQQNTIMVFDRSESDTNTSFIQSSDAYAQLVDRQVSAKKAMENCDQEIEKYTERINALEATAKDGSEQKVKDDLEKLTQKTNELLVNVRDTVNEYYEEVILKNSYEILSRASDSFFPIIKSALKNSVFTIAEVLLVLTGLYILVCTVCVFPKFSNLLDKFEMKRHDSKENKKKSNKKK